MKNIFKFKAMQNLAAIIAAVSIISFSLTSCGDSDSGGIPATSGRLTIEIPQEHQSLFNGKFAYAEGYGDGDDLLGAAEDMLSLKQGKLTATFGKVDSNGKVTLKVWIVEGYEDDGDDFFVTAVKPFSGSGEYEFFVFFYDTASGGDDMPEHGSFAVTFTNGKGTSTNFTKIDE